MIICFLPYKFNPFFREHIQIIFIKRYPLYIIYTDSKCLAELFKVTLSTRKKIGGG